MKITKRKKIEFFISIFSILFIVIIFLNFRRFHAKFHNRTGENIDSLVIAGTLIGNLKNKESTQQIPFNKFTFSDDIPYEEIDGFIKLKKISQFNWSWCGTGIKTKSNGFYYFDIKKTLDEKGNPCLYLVQHNKKIFWEEK